jgi:hypothetical protein
MPSATATPWIERLPSGQRVILNVGRPQRLRSNQTLSALNLQPRAATKPSLLRIVTMSLSILRAALSSVILEIDVVAIGMNASLQAMLDDLESCPSSVPLLIVGNLVHDKTHNALLVSSRRRIGAPNLRQPARSASRMTTGSSERQRASPAQAGADRASLP